MIKYFRFVLAAVLLCGLAGVASASPKGASKHAIVKVAKVSMKVAVAAPKATVVGLKDTIGGVIFAVEFGNDILLGGLTGADKAAGMELKHNPFHYAAVVDGKVDAGLEAAYLFFFNAKI